MNPHLFHDATFYALYAAAALATFVIIERGIFFAFNVRRAHELDRLTAIGAVTAATEALSDPGRVDVAADAMRTVMRRAGELPAAQRDSAIEAAYIAAHGKLKRHLWLLDTIVTAAPLLGLLGTILGIIDTFTALAKSGISDPSGVSAGIGTALFATALGIGVALYGLLFFNLFQERVERMSDVIKVLLLRGAAAFDRGPVHAG